MANHWFNFKAGVPWHTNTCMDASVFQHPVNTILGWTPWHFLIDWLHVVDLGTASHACGNIIFDIVYHKLRKMTRANAANKLAEELGAMPVEQVALKIKH